MVAVRIISVLGALTMAVAVVLALFSGGFSNEGSAIWALAWGKVTLIDLYIGLVFFGLWVLARERRPLVVVAWWASLLVLGNLAAALYLVRASFNSSNVYQLLTGETPRPRHQVAEGDVVS